MSTTDQTRAPQPVPQPVQPSDIAAGHNPDRLTNAQVETHLGWRLLEESEAVLLFHQSLEPLAGVQIYSHSIERWSGGLWGTQMGYTYRTCLSPADLAKARGIQPSAPQVHCPKCGGVYVSAVAKSPNAETHYCEPCNLHFTPKWPGEPASEEPLLFFEVAAQMASEQKPTPASESAREAARSLRRKLCVAPECDVEIEAAITAALLAKAREVEGLREELSQTETVLQHWRASGIDTGNQLQRELEEHAKTKTQRNQLRAELAAALGREAQGVKGHAARIHKYKELEEQLAAERTKREAAEMLRDQYSDTLSAICPSLLDGRGGWTCEEIISGTQKLYRECYDLRQKLAALESELENCRIMGMARYQQEMQPGYHWTNERADKLQSENAVLYSDRQRVAKYLANRADWLKSEYLKGGDFEHLSAREKEVRFLVINLKALTTPAPTTGEGATVSEPGRLSLSDPDKAFFATLTPRERLDFLKFRVEWDLFQAKACRLAVEHPQAWEAFKATFVAERLPPELRNFTPPAPTESSSPHSE